MKSEEAYKALKNYFWTGYLYQICNAYIFMWESDFFCINREGYSFEFEVKVSRSDFRADFKKPKHEMFSGRQEKKFLPNRFYYVVPENMIFEKDIPIYAGLIYVSKGHCWIVKRAPFLHKKKHDFRKILCDKFYHQWAAMKVETIRQEGMIWQLREQLKNMKLLIPTDKQ